MAFSFCLLLIVNGRLLNGWKIDPDLIEIETLSPPHPAIVTTSYSVISGTTSSPPSDKNLNYSKDSRSKCKNERECRKKNPNFVPRVSDITRFFKNAYIINTSNMPVNYYKST